MEGLINDHAFQHGGCPWRLQKIYKGTQGVLYFSSSHSPLSPMLKDERSFKHGGGLI
jgi:hypothetical protein